MELNPKLQNQVDHVNEFYLSLKLTTGIVFFYLEHRIERPRNRM